MSKEMNNIEAAEELKEMRNKLLLTGRQGEAVSIAIDTIKLRIPKPPVHVKAYCGTCGHELTPGQKVCDSCGQWILWEGHTT